MMERDPASEHLPFEINVSRWTMSQMSLVSWFLQLDFNVWLQQSSGIESIECYGVCSVPTNISVAIFRVNDASYLLAFYSYA
jgi:hypothetical protein